VVRYLVYDSRESTDWAGRALKYPSAEESLMAANITERVREIAEARGVPESEVFERALERGVEDLWTELTISRYLNDEISRSEAVERVGEDRIERAEREAEAVEEDVRWGLRA
jgi:hypothetical protein